MFQTRRPQKHLKITIESVSDTSILIHHIDLSSLQKVLSESIGLLPEGNLKITCKVEDIVILMWDFKDFTPCRGASFEDFVGIDHSERYFTIENASLRGKGEITLPYFTLVRNKKTDDFDKKDILYTFPECSENERVEALRNSLQANGYIVKRWDSSKTVEHYCQFSGGGDIYICKDNVPVLVFTVPEDSSPDEDPPATESSFQASPSALGDTKLVSLTIEGKRHL